MVTFFSKIQLDSSAIFVFISFRKKLSKDYFHFQKMDKIVIHFKKSLSDCSSLDIDKPLLEISSWIDMGAVGWCNHFLSVVHILTMASELLLAHLFQLAIN